MRCSWRLPSVLATSASVLLKADVPVERWDFGTPDRRSEDGRRGSAPDGASGSIGSVSIPWSCSASGPSRGMLASWPSRPTAPGLLVLKTLDPRTLEPDALDGKSLYLEILDSDWSCSRGCPSRSESPLALDDVFLVFLHRPTSIPPSVLAAEPSHPTARLLAIVDGTGGGPSPDDLFPGVLMSGVAGRREADLASVPTSPVRPALSTASAIFL